MKNFFKHFLPVFLAYIDYTSLAFQTLGSMILCIISIYTLKHYTELEFCIQAGGLLGFFVILWCLVVNSIAQYRRFDWDNRDSME